MFFKKIYHMICSGVFPPKFFPVHLVSVNKKINVFKYHYCVVIVLSSDMTWTLEKSVGKGQRICQITVTADTMIISRVNGCYFFLCLVFGDSFGSFLCNFKSIRSYLFWLVTCCFYHNCTCIQGIFEEEKQFGLLKIFCDGCQNDIQSFYECK